MAQIEISLSEYKTLKANVRYFDSELNRREDKIAILLSTIEELKDEINSFAESSLFERTIGWRTTKKNLKKILNKKIEI